MLAATVNIGCLSRLRTGALMVPLCSLWRTNSRSSSSANDQNTAEASKRTRPAGLLPWCQIARQHTDAFVSPGELESGIGALPIANKADITAEEFDVKQPWMRTFLEFKELMKTVKAYVHAAGANILLPNDTGVFKAKSAPNGETSDDIFDTDCGDFGEGGWNRWTSASVW